MEGQTAFLHLILRTLVVNKSKHIFLQCHLLENINLFFVVAADAADAI